jgi:glycosyltransferase involved in cell wall biosynthesis
VNDYPAGNAYGGAEVYLERLIDAQRARGDEVELLCADEPRSGLARVRDLWDPSAHRRLREQVRAFRPDVVHFHNVARELSAAVLLPVPAARVMTVHDMRWLGGSEHHLPDPRAVADRVWLGPVMRRLVRSFDATVGVSRALVDVLSSAGLPHPTMVAVPVPPPLVTPPPASSARDVLFVGKLSRDKGVHVLREAFAQLAPEHPEARLVMVGDGPEHAHLSRSAPPWLELTGRLDPRSVSEVLGRARVVAVPSLPALRREGYPLVAVEAARHGRPVVVSDDPGLVEAATLVGGDVTPAGDADALAARLRWWLGDPEDADRAGAQADRAASAVHDPRDVARAFAEVYERAVAARG